jgi:transposase InsO family protein
VRDLAVLLLHLLATIARLARPGGARSVVAEPVLVKHQLLILNRSRKRSGNLRPSDLAVAGLCALLMSPRRLVRAAIVFKPSTLLRLHRALTQRKYRRLFSSTGQTKPGPKRPSQDVIAAVVDMKFCESAVLRTHWVLVVMDQCTRRIVGFGVHRGDVDGVALCRMFNRATRGQPSPKFLSSDHDPLYRFHQWQANLRILEVKGIKTVPYVPLSHPFVERLIGAIRRECLDHTTCWTAADLEMKLLQFQRYYNGHRAHAGLDGRTPDAFVDPSCARARLSTYQWQRHCRGLYQTPIAA